MSATRDLGQGFRALLLRELALHSRSGSTTVLVLVFYLAVFVILPLALGPDQKLLTRLGPAFLWLAALLSVLLSLDRLLVADNDNGTLDLLATSGLSPMVILLAKTLAHWISTGLAITLLSPLAGLLTGLSLEAMAWSALSLALGTPALSSLAMIGAALTVSLRQGGLLRILIVLPFAFPALIFGVSLAKGPGAHFEPFNQSLLFLSAYSLLLMGLVPFMASLALKSRP